MKETVRQKEKKKKEKKRKKKEKKSERKFKKKTRNQIYLDNWKEFGWALVQNSFKKKELVS